jgi:hypothetical protein
MEQMDLVVVAEAEPIIIPVVLAVQALSLSNLLVHNQFK